MSEIFIILPILQRSKLRHRDAKACVQDHTDDRCQNQPLTRIQRFDPHSICLRTKGFTVPFTPCLVPQPSSSPHFTGEGKSETLGMHEKSLKVPQPVREEFPTVQTQGSQLPQQRLFPPFLVLEAARVANGPS